MPRLPEGLLPQMRGPAPHDPAEGLEVLELPEREAATMMLRS